MRDRLRADLFAAVKVRDRTASAALRSVLASIDNAEAVQMDSGADGHVGSEHVAGAVSGLGAAERRRRAVSDEEIAAIIRDELSQHLDAVARASAAGMLKRADEHAGRARVLSRYLPDPM